MFAKSSRSASAAALLSLFIGSACEEDPETSGGLPDAGKSATGGTLGASGSSFGGAAGATGGRAGNGGSSPSGGTAGSGASAGTSDASATGGSLGSSGSSDDAGQADAANPTAIKQPFAVGSHWNERTKYASMRAAGVQMIRMDISWDHVEPTPGPFDWSNVDQAMAEAKNQNIQVLAVVGYTNDWASSGNGQPGEVHQYAPLESYDDDWGDFVQQAANRYGNQVAAWEIWNEPDHDNFLRMANGTWASNHYPSESAVNKKRLEYKHLLEIALAQPALANKTITTSGFAEGGGYDTGFRAWLVSQSGFLNQFQVASFHTYGYPSYQRLIDVPASYRSTQAAIGKANWPFWITEHGINTTGVASGTVKTYLIRSFATALAQPGVEKLFWFRAAYDPGHMDLYDAAGNTTAAYAAFKTLTSHWVQPTAIVSWSSASTPRGSIATLSSGNRVAIVWNDGAGVAIQSLGLNIANAHDQDGNTLSTSSTLTSAPVFLALTD